MTQSKLRGFLVCAVAGAVVVVFIAKPTKRAQIAVSNASAANPAQACRASLEEMNAAFREVYAATRARNLEESGPVILLTGDELVLIDAGQQTRATVIPSEYHTLKAVSHAPLCMYVLLEDHADRPFSAADVETIARFAAAMRTAREQLDAAAFPPSSLPQQQEMLDRCLALADSIKVGDTFPRERLFEFCRGEAAPIWEGVDQATRLQIDGLDAQVRAWREQLGPEKWSRLHVVVIGMHTPRVGNLAMQYFRHILGPDVDDKRLVYAEGAVEEDRALRTLGTVLLDTGVGEAFFDDPSRMLRDLLADSAEAYLKTLPKPAETEPQ